MTPRAIASLPFKLIRRLTVCHPATLAMVEIALKRWLLLP
jgi:hypothetical protein